MRPLLKVALTS